MPAPPFNLPNVSEITLHYAESVTVQRAMNRLYVLSSSLTAGDVFTRFDTAWQAAILAATVSTARLERVDITKLDLQTATQSFNTTGIKYDGGAAGEFSPASAYIMKFTTGFRDLASHGRIYLPYMAEAAIINGRLQDATFTALQAASELWVNTLSSQGIPLQVVSRGRWDHPTLEDKPPANHTVTAVAVQSVLGTQRGRQARLRGT